MSTNVYNYAELEIVPCTVYDLTVTPALEVRFTFFRKTYTNKNGRARQQLAACLWPTAFDSAWKSSV